MYTTYDDNFGDLLNDTIVEHDITSDAIEHELQMRIKDRKRMRIKERTFQRQHGIHTVLPVPQYSKRLHHKSNITKNE